MNDIIENIMSQLEKQENKMKIIVVSINNTININNSNNDEASSAQIPLNEVICPICKEPCKLEMKNYKIKLFGCKHRHKTENIKLDEYMNYQNIDSLYLSEQQLNLHFLSFPYQKYKGKKQHYE